MRTVETLFPGCYPGTVICGVEDRIERVRNMSIDDLREALRNGDVQLSVKKAAERQLRRLTKHGHQHRRTQEVA